VNVGFIGIGRMGLPMAANVLAAGHVLSVWNRTAEKCAPLEAAGARVAEDIPALGRDVEAVVTMVSDGPAARGILVDGGLLDALTPGSVVLEMSTIGPLEATALAEEAIRRGVDLLDAPVSGSVSTAEAGQLTAIVGGDEQAYARVRPVLDAMTKRHMRLGPSGSGAAMKLALNGVVAATNESIAEAIVLAERYGVARERAYDALAEAIVASPFVHYKRDAFLRPETEPVAFAVELMRKDVRLALALAESLKLELPVVAAAAEMLARASAAGLDEADFSRVADVLRLGTDNRPQETKEEG
jgi:3-hydroxyisobutyrate dehydrogenase